MNASLYSNTSELLLAGTAYAPGACSLSATYTTGAVLGSTSVTIQVTPTATVASNNGYFTIQMPKDSLNRLDQKTPTCSNCARVDVFYDSSLIRFTPTSTHFTGSSATYTIVGLSAPAHKMTSQTVSLQVSAYSNSKAVSTCTASVTLEATECSVFTFAVGSVSSLTGLAQPVSYSFSFKTGHRVPSYGAITITFPSAFGRLSGHSCSSVLPCAATAEGVTLTFSE
jgi:hypothetical protein